MKHIAVLLTVHNRKKHTLRCLTNLYSQTLPEDHSMEVYLTDDGCTDGTPEAIRAEFPQVHIVQGDGNLFWNRGMYAAWCEAEKSADHDFYLWLNDDTFLYSDSISTLIAVSALCHHSALIVGTTAAVGNKSKITYGGRMGERLLKPNGTLQECNMINGNIVLIPRHVYKIVGKNDPYYHHAIGDNDYGLRVIENGLKNFVAPHIVGECDLHETEETWCNSQVPFIKRWKALRKPNGIQPEQFLHFERKHFGLFKACFHYFSTHLHCIFPFIWKYKNNHNI